MCDETIQVDMQNPETKLASIPDEPDDELRLNLALYLATQLREINCIVHRKHAHYNKLKQVAEELVKKKVEFEARVLKRRRRSLFVFSGYYRGTQGARC